MPTVCYYCLLSTILAPSSMKSVMDEDDVLRMMWYGELSTFTTDS
jgi:hypothetical protein